MYREFFGLISDGCGAALDPLAGGFLAVALPHPAGTASNALEAFLTITHLGSGR